MSDTQQWLEWLFGQSPPGLIWVGGHGDEFKGRTFSEPGGAAEYASWLDDGAAGGVYFRLTLMNPVADGRGKASDSSHLVAFGADLDLAGPGHKEAKLPRPGSEGELRSILTAAGAPEPTAWVHSGGGRYAFWKLAEPIALGSETLLSEAAGVSSALHANIIAEAAVRGLKIDNTRDLARIYRLPGTHNRKGDIPFVAKVLSSDGPRHSISGMRGSRTPPSDTVGHPPSPAKTPLDTVGHPLVGQQGAARGASVLFRDDAAVDLSVRLAQPVRDFTVTEARAYCDPFIAALMAAPVGEINVRLNDAAVAMAHFGREFWTREHAEAVLAAALESTEYDGATWKAGDTIRSAYDATAAGQKAAGDGAGGAFWRAVLVRDARAGTGAADHEAAAAAVTEDAVAALLDEMLTADELATRKPPRYLIEGLLQFDSESWLIGEPGSKKSFVALDMAGHVATGKAWQGRRVNPALVVFIVAEGAGGSAPRVKAWQQRYGVMGDGIRFLPRPVQSADLSKWAVLVEACRRLSVAAAASGRGMLVVLDTQARVTVGLKENDATDMGVFIDAVGAIRAASGACVLTIHHTGRKGGDARGSSAIDGAQTTELKVVKVRELYGKLITEKQKDIAEADPIKIKFESVPLGADEDGRPVDSLVMAPAGSWLEAEMDDESFAALDREAVAVVTPFAGRQAVEPWTYRRTDPKAVLQRWLLQALADTAEDRGLTQSEWRGVVEEKIGKQTATTWRKAFQMVTGLKFDGVVLKVHGADRWVVDRVAIEAEGGGEATSIST